MLKKILLLFGVVLTLIFSTPFTSIGILAVAASDTTVSEYSSVQSDLEGFGLTEEDYVLDEESNRQVSCFLFVEDIEDDNYYYYLYLYDPKAFTIVPTSAYKQIQISHLTSNFEDLLDDDTAVERALNYYDLTYLSCSDNGTVAKYLVNNLKFADPKTYRRYQIRQLSYYLNNQKNHFTIGDEYLYETLSDGSVSYKYKKMDYITLYNVTLDTYIIDEVLDIPISFLVNLDKLASFLGGEFYLGKYDFYGFSLPSDLEITDLISIDFSYYKYDYVFYKPGTDFDKAEIFTNSAMLKASDYVPVKSNGVYYPEVEITDYEVIANIDNKWLGSQKNKWNTISTYDELKNISNDEMRTGLMKTFKDCEYIVNYAGDYCIAKTEEFAYALNSDTSKYDPFIYALQEYNDCVLEIYDGLSYTYSKYTTTWYGGVEAVKLTLNSEGRIYDLSVIVAPQDSPDNPKGANPNTNWLQELWEKICAWVEETFGTETPLTEVIAIIIIIISIIMAIFVILAIIKLAISGLVKLIFEAIWAIISFPFKLLFGNNKKHNSDKYYTHNNNYEKRDRL